ncbi:hypothetical protein EHS25_007250 [Saitozyma podzolica]|uniref:Uncharacterized protein n=1 Tax=Saitozyma podzolica TaxID=1890683 RepID=A0A427XMN8_9TREE|nr:hypothetical protein EHS25_007250 [Saitozyma podzolica]
MCRRAFGQSKQVEGVFGRVFSMLSSQEFQALDEELELSYREICHFTPYLPARSQLLRRVSNELSLSDALLVSITTYLSAYPFIERPFFARLCDELALTIPQEREAIFLQVPISLSTIQALEILSAFAPLGVLPGQRAQPSSIVRARGQAVVAQSVAHAIQLDAQVREAISIGVDPAWRSVAVWVWLSVQATEATMALEEESIVAPGSLAEAAGVAEKLVPLAAKHPDDPAVLAKLALCEGLLRLAVVHEAVSAFQVATQDTQISSMINKSESIAQTRTSAHEKFDGLIDRFDTLTGRATRAMTRAADPDLMAQFFVCNRGSPIAEMVMTWVTSGGESLEELLVSFAELRREGCLVPLHHLFAAVVNVGSVMVELQTALSILGRSIESFRQHTRTKQRLFILRQAGKTMRELEFTSREGRTVGDMAGDLIDSMISVAQNRVRDLGETTVGRRGGPVMGSPSSTTASPGTAGATAPLPAPGVTACDAVLLDMLGLTAEELYGADSDWQNRFAEKEL